MLTKNSWQIVSSASVNISDRQRKGSSTSLGCCAIYDINPKLSLNANLAKSRLTITYLSVSNCARSTTVILSWSVQNFKAIGQLKRMLCMIEILRDLSLRWITGGYPILQSIPSRHRGLHNWWIIVYTRCCYCQTTNVYWQFLCVNVKLGLWFTSIKHMLKRECLAI